MASGLTRMSVRSGTREIYSAARRFAAAPCARSAASDARLAAARPSPRVGCRDASTGVSQNGHTCQRRSSGALQPDARLAEPRRAHGADEEAGLDRGAAHGTTFVRRAQRLERLHLELALAHLVQVLGRPEEHVDDGADEGRHEAEHRRHRDEPGILDAAPRVLVRPVADREPEDDEEEEQEVARDGHVCGVEEVGEQ